MVVVECYKLQAVQAFKLYSISTVNAKESLTTQNGISSDEKMVNPNLAGIGYTSRKMQVCVFQDRFNDKNNASEVFTCDYWTVLYGSSDKCVVKP